MYLFLIIVIGVIVVGTLLLKNKSQKLTFKYFAILTLLGALAVGVSFVLGTYVSTWLTWTFAGYYYVEDGVIIWNNIIAEVLYYFINCFLVVAVIEEYSKSLIIKKFDGVEVSLKTTLDCITQFVIVGVVFAILEDIMYIVRYDAGLTRLLITLSGHFMYALVFGYYYSKSKIYKEFTNIGVKLNARGYQLKRAISGNKARAYMAKATLIPILLHGTHNFIAYVLPDIAVIFIIIETILFLRYFIKAIRNNYSIHDKAIELFISKYPKVTKEEIEEILINS